MLERYAFATPDAKRPVCPSELRRNSLFSGGNAMHWTDRRKRFRALLSGERCIHPGSVFDPISARIAEDLGFELGMFAGSTASLTALGAPDLIVLTLSEFAGQAYRINRAGGLPLLVDADHGYGNALNVKRTVEELETAGVAALSIEDTDLPTPFGTTKPRLTTIEEGVGKMKAAIAGRQDPLLAIAGRTSAIQIAGLDDAIARGKAYEQVGVDALFFVGVRTRAELDALSTATKLPIILGGGTPELSDRDYLASRRVRIALQGHQPFAAAVKAVHDTLKALRDGTPPAKLTGVADAELMKRVTRDADYSKWTKEFLGG
jgi:oxaloacetate decarboxylase